MKTKKICMKYLFGLLVLSLLALAPKQMVASPNTLSDTSALFTSFDGVKIHFESKGAGQPVLLVHGFIVNGESWKKSALYDDLLKKGFRVIILDLRGNGQSDKPHEAESYAHDAEAKDIMGLMDQLGIRQYEVVGYSRGSIITARLLVLDKRITKAVMGGMGTDFTNPDWPRRINFYKALSGEPIKELESMVKYVKDAGLDQQALACLQKEQPSTSKAELAAVLQPVLVISGEQDSDNGSAAELAKLFKYGQKETTPGDHGAAMRTPEFSTKVIAFLLQ